MVAFASCMRSALSMLFYGRYIAMMSHTCSKIRRSPESRLCALQTSLCLHLPSPQTLLSMSRQLVHFLASDRSE